MNQWIDIKPLSVNVCWQGRRFKTRVYKQYEKEMLNAIENKKMPSAPFVVWLSFKMSNSMSDIDNPIKPALDILQKKFKFNDRDIHKLIVIKSKCEKGKEGLHFDIQTFLP